MTTFIRALIMGTAALLAAQANAQPQWLSYAEANRDGLREARVSYADLDLEAEAGRETLRQRVDHAVKMVCLEDPGVRAAFGAENACRASLRTFVDGELATAMAERGLGRRIGREELAVAAR